MIKDLFDNISEYTKSRLTNPFFGTLTGVWIIRNFIFIYALFNFAEGVTLTQKVDYIRKYFLVHGTWQELVINIMIAFCILFSAFTLLLITRLFTNWYSAALNWLNSKTAKNTMTENKVHSALRSDYEEIKQKYEKLKEEEVHFNKTLKQINEELTTIQAAQHTTNMEVIKIENEKFDLDIKLSNLKKDYDQIYLQNSDLLVASADKERLAKMLTLNKEKNTIDINSLKAFTEQYLITTSSLSLETRRDLAPTVLNVVKLNLWKEFMLVNLAFDLQISDRGGIDKNKGYKLIETGVLNSKRTSIVALNDKLLFTDLIITGVGVHCYSIIHDFYLKYMLQKSTIDNLNIEIS